MAYEDETRYACLVHRTYSSPLKRGEHFAILRIFDEKDFAGWRIFCTFADVFSNYEF